MMRRAFRVLICTLALLLSSRQSLGLVLPMVATVAPPSWLAQIYVDRAGVLTEFCKGALIHAEWILTTGFCVLDPFEALGPMRDERSAKFVVRFAGSEEVHPIDRYVKSEYMYLGMMKLAAPVAIQPATLSRLLAAELRGQQVFILGQHSTAAVGDSFFNPSYGLRMQCRVDGQVFFRDGAACYVLPRLVRHSTFLQANGIVVDPTDPAVPKQPIDTAIPFNTDGSRLYLDFRANGSYPCHEDVGAPVLRRTSGGSLEIVGVVAGVGMTVGMPLCSPALGNLFPTAAWHREFIDTTIAQDAFNEVCPARPVLNVEYLPDQNVRVWWDAVDGASGYRLMYTSAAGYEPFATLDVGNRTQVRTVISADLVYSVAIVAYNAVCSSVISDALAVSL